MWSLMERRSRRRRSCSRYSSACCRPARAASSFPAAADYYVLVFPTERKYWTPGTRRIVMARPGTDGAFTATGLAAGDYYVAALTDLEPGEWNDTQLLDQLVGSAVKVMLRTGEITK